jgi:hypothetical protein
VGINRMKLSFHNTFLMITDSLPGLDPNFAHLCGGTTKKGSK